MNNKRLREYLDTIKKANLGYNITKRDIDEYIEEKDYKKIYNELKKKYDVPYDFDTLFYSSGKVNIDDLNKYYNYLLSLNKDIYNEYVWNDIELDGDKYIGKAQKMYYKKMSAYKKWANKHNNFNHTKEESDGIISIRPMRNNDSHIILNSLFRNRKKEEIDDGLWYGIQFPDTAQEHFFSIIVDTKLVGIIGLQLLKSIYAKSKNVYTIFYYVIPKYRNNHYATRAVKLLVDMAFNNKIIVDQLDKKYDYVINRLPLDIRIIYAVIKDMNEYSKNVIMNNNFKISGNFKNIDTDLNNELWDWYLIEKNDYLNQIIS